MDVVMTGAPAPASPASAARLRGTQGVPPSFAALVPPEVVAATLPPASLGLAATMGLSAPAPATAPTLRAVAGYRAALGALDD